MISIDDRIISDTQAHYRYLHRHPELSFREESTSAYVRRTLERNGIQTIPAGKTGLLGFIPGRNPSRTIALRADMDALPIEENPAHPIVSGHPGCMHACGHDLHTGCLLGAAVYLNACRTTLPVNVLLIFQAGEEVLPGGAIDILGHPFFQAHRPEWIIAQHAEPDLPVGSVGICPGHYMASGDEIYITLEGPGGHAALPEKSVDLILVASHIVIALQQIVSRNASPFIPTVLTFGQISCQSLMNILPKEIRLEGTFRTFDEKWRTEAKKRIQDLASSIAESMGAHPHIRIVEGYPVLYNDPEKARLSEIWLSAEFGREKVIRLPQRMTTEDFARYSQVLPSTFIRLGVQGEQGKCGKLHTPDFFPDPAAIAAGIRTLCTLVLNYSDR